MRRFRSESTAQCYEANVNGPQTGGLSIRRAETVDAARIADIFNEGVEDRVATFETRAAGPADAERWIAEDIVVVAERDGALVAWAKAGPYTDRHDYYAGVREATMYVARDARRTGIGHQLLAALAEASAQEGAHKLVGKVFTSNEPSIALLKGLGWREVGVHLRHGTLDGEWKDVLVVEKLLHQPD
jgi:L-amino acid N-acyltransferase YncA